MVKEKPKLQKNLARFGSGARKFMVGLTQAQPTTTALIIMGLTVAVRPAVPKESDMNRHLDGLFAVSRDLGVAAAVAPVAVGGLSSLTAFLERPKPKK